MEILEEPFDDRSDLNADGTYDYIYTGVYFRCRDGSSELVFAWYEDEPSCAYLKYPSSWQPALFESNMFVAAVEHLRQVRHVITVKILDPTSGSKGYVDFNERNVQAIHQQIGRR